MYKGHVSGRRKMFNQKKFPEHVHKNLSVFSICYRRFLHKLNCTINPTSLMKSYVPIGA